MNKKCKFCGKPISGNRKYLFCMTHHNKPSESDFVQICYECEGEIMTMIEDIADSSNNRSR